MPARVRKSSESPSRRLAAGTSDTRWKVAVGYAVCNIAERTGEQIRVSFLGASNRQVLVVSGPRSTLYVQPDVLRAPGLQELRSALAKFASECEIEKERKD